MKALLVLQIPTADLRYGRVLAASSDSELIDHFCTAVLSEQEQRLAASRALADHELESIRLEQLRARLRWATEAICRE